MNRTIPRESAKNFHNGYDLRDVEEQRMYQIVPYNLRGIQQGIQGGHAKDEYAEDFDDDYLFKRWRRFDKTYIILEGGTFNTRLGGGMEDKLQQLRDLGVKCFPFYEVDANDGLTGIAFLAPKRAFDRENYPVDTRRKSYESEVDCTLRVDQEIEAMGGQELFNLRNFIYSMPLAKG